MALAVAVVVSAAPASGETPTPVRSFRLFDKTRAPGLPQSTVMDLLQDEAGVLWIATLDGLGTFDGTSLQPVEPVPDAPVYGSLYSLARRRAGGIWVGGATDVWSWDGEGWRVYPAPGAASSIAEDGLGRLWRVDQTGGLWRFDESRLDPMEASLGDGAGDADAALTAAGPWIRVPTPSWLGAAVAVHAPVRSPRADQDPQLDARTGPKLWLAGQHGVGMLLAGDTRFDAVAGGSRPADAEITAMLPTRDGTCWVATTDGRLHYTVAGGWRGLTLEGWQGGHVRTLAEDLRGRVWAGGLAGGLAFGGETSPDAGWTVWDESSGLRSEGVVALLADREGTMWIAANGFGLQQWIGEEWSHRNVWSRDDRDDGRQPVFGISPTLDGRGFYAAAFARGIWHWDGRRMYSLGLEHGLEENVRSAFEPEPGVLWVSARFGLYERRAPGERFHWAARVPTGFVYRVQRAPDGSYWAATSAHGVLRRAADAVGDDAWQPLEDVNRELPDRNVKAMLFRRAEGGVAEVWLGTLAGLVVFRPDVGQTLVSQTLPQDAATALPTAVQALLEDPLGDVWVAGFGGVSRVPGGDLSTADVAPIETLTQADGLPGHTIYSLAVRGGAADAPELWLGGSDGVGRMPLDADRRPGDRRTIAVYDTTDGLIEDECNHMGLYAAPDGSMVVGTMASLARFDPQVRRLDPAPLRIRWLERPDADTELAASRRSVQLRWHAPWLAPETVEYRTRVPRLSPAWSEPTTRARLDLENLGPGDWTVEVSARVDAGEGGAEWIAPVVTAFRIEPYFHETAWFLGLSGVLLAVLVALIVRWRTRRLRRRAEELQTAVDEALARIRVLGGLLPICAGCKKVRDDEGYWQQIESYLHVHSEAELSHGLCPDCATELYGAYLQPEKLAADEAAEAADRVAAGDGSGLR